MNEVVIPLKIQGIAQIKAELRELKSEIANATDPSTVAELSQKAGELADKIKDANEAVKVFSTGSKFEQVSNGLGGIKDSLMSLDFEEAAQKSKTFASALSTIGKSDISKALMGAAGMVKTLGLAFMKMGAMLLVNPIFLLVIIIVAIVTAIVLFLKKIGVLTAIMEFLGEVIGAVVQFFKDLADFIGITDNAGDDRREAESKRFEEEMAEKQRLKEINQQIFDNEQANFDRRIAIMESEGKSSYKLQVQKIQQSKAFAEAEDQSLAIGIENLKLLIDQAYESEFITEQLTKSLREQEKLRNATQQLALNEASKLTVLENTENKKNTDNYTKALEKRKEAKIKHDKELEDINKKAADVVAAADKVILASQRTAQENEIAAIQEKYTKDLEAINLQIKEGGKKNTITTLEIEKARQIQIAAINKKYIEDAIKAEDAKYVELQRVILTSAGKIHEYEILQAQIAFEEKTAKLKEGDALLIALKTELETNISNIRNRAAQEEIEKSKEVANKKIEDERKVLEAKRTIRNEEVQMAKGIVTLLAGLGEKNKKIQKAALIANGALSIAEIINNSNVGASKEVATKGVTGLATGAILYIKMATSIASVVAATAKGLSALGGGSISGDSGGNSGGGGGGGTSTTAVAPSGPSLFGNANTGSQVNAGGANGNNITITAVVSETEITASQNHINNIQQNSVL